jgi:hypothetical protein
MKLLICFILALTSLTANTSTPGSGKPRASQSRIGTDRSAHQPRASAKDKSPSRVASNRKCEACARSANGRIARSATARRAFERGSPSPSTGRSVGACPGYVIDHVQALKHGGLDEPDNMQWQRLKRRKRKTEPNRESLGQYRGRVNGRPAANKLTILWINATLSAPASVTPDKRHRRTLKIINKANAGPAQILCYEQWRQTLIA